MKRAGQWVSAAVGLSITVSTPAVAQLCNGLADVSVTPRTVSATAAGTDLGRSVVARYGLAGERVFGGAQVGYSGPAFADVDRPVLGADVGIAIPLGASGRTQLCPTLSTEYQRGRGPALVQNRLATSVALSLGHAVRLSSAVTLVPFVQGGLQQLHQTFAATTFGTDADGRPGLGRAGHVNDLFGEVGVGFGVRIHQRFTLSPSFRRPVGLGVQRAPNVGSVGNGRLGVPQQTFTLGLTVGLPR